MSSGWKKTTRRSTDTLRLLAQLGKAKEPYLRRVIDFFRDLWEIVEDNPHISIQFTMTDGFRVYHDDQCLFYMHIDRCHWALLFLNEDHLFYGPTKNRQYFNLSVPKGSHSEMWRLKESEEFAYLLRRIRDLSAST